MRTMYDSTNASAIPADAQMVAGYVDGAYAKWSDADWQRFPNAVKVRIAVFPTTNDGHVLDVESGDATPEQAPAWCAMRRSAGQEPTIYSTADNIAKIQALMADDPPQFWLASWDNIPDVPPGYIAKQYLNGPAYDTSWVADFWPGVDPWPTPSLEYRVTALEQGLARLNQVLVARFNGVRAALDPENPPS